MRKLVQIFRFFFFCGIFTLIGSELLLRFFNPPALKYYRDLKLLHVYHPEYGVGLAPNESRMIRQFSGQWSGRITTNSLGLRGLKEPEKGVGKILCLGDSLVMGFGVSDEDTFCHLLDGIRINTTTYQALNLGVDAYGSMGSAKRLEDILQNLESVQAVLFFVSPNDYSIPDSLRAQGILPDDETDQIRENDPVWKERFRLQFEATRISYLLQALKLSYEQILLQKSQSILAGKEEWESLTTNPINYFSASFFRTGKSNSECQETHLTPTNRSGRDGNTGDSITGSVPAFEPKMITCPEKPEDFGYSCLDSEPNPESLPELPELTQRAYMEMYQKSLQEQFRFIPVMLPTQLEEIYCNQVGKFHPLGIYRLQALKFWKQKSVPVIDLMPDTLGMCSRDSKIQDYFIPGDGHLTEKGNQWVNQRLQIHLREKLK
jgi:hypothetical protein